jgi:hypothetical protein
MWLGFVTAHAASVHCAPAPDGIVGPLPLRVECMLAESAGTTWERVRWSFGDGATAEGSVVVHSYTSPGRFDVSAEILGFRAHPISTPETRLVVARELVLACAPPEPKFDWSRVSGRVVALEDRSRVDPSCVYGYGWTVTDADGTVVFGPSDETSDLVLLPHDGPFVARLRIDGVGGAAMAEATLQLPAPPTDAPAVEEPEAEARGCAVAPTSAGWLGLVLVLLGLVRARRGAP